MVWGRILGYAIAGCSSLPFADRIVIRVLHAFGFRVLDRTSCSLVLFICWWRGRADEAASESGCQGFEQVGETNSQVNIVNDTVAKS